MGHYASEMGYDTREDTAAMVKPNNIQIYLDDLDKEVARLQDGLDHLENRASAFLRPEMPSEKAMPQDVPETSPVGLRITSAVIKMQRLNNRLTDTIARFDS